MVKNFTLLIFLLLGFHSFAQGTKEQELLAKLASASVDSAKADVYMDLHNAVFKTDLEKAKEYANGILKYGLLAHNWHFVEIGYLGLARCDRKKRTYNTVLPYDFKALEFAKKLDNTNQIFICASQIANDYLDAEQEKEAFKYMFLANELAIKTNKPANIGKAEETIGYYYYQHNQPAKAIPYLQKAINDNLQGLDLYRVNRSRTWLGFCMMQLNQTKGLAEMIFEAMEYFKKSNTIYSQADCYRLLGFCNLASGDYNDALTNFAAARKIYEDTGNLMEQGFASNDLGKNYIYLKDYEKAKKYITEAEALFVSNKYNLGIISSKTLWGQYYSFTKQYKAADRFFLEANVLLKNNPNNELLISNETYWAENAYRQKNNKKGDSLTYSYAKRIANNHGEEFIAAGLKGLKDDYNRIDSNTFNRLVMLFKKGGAERLRKKYPHKNLKEIIPVIDSISTLNPDNGFNLKHDSTDNRAFNNRLLELEMLYRTRIKNDSLKMERENATIVKEDLDERNYWLIASVVFVLLLAIGFFIQRKYRLRAEADNRRIELLKNEIHHRVTNNLAIISRLIEVAEKASVGTIPLKSLKNRIDTIALLHQHLYQDKVIDSVNMQHYFTELVTIIKQTFETDKNIGITIDAPVVLSATTAGTIGLLVNELVTNSFKYAFEGRSSGTIKIGAKRSTAGNFELQVADDGTGMGLENNTGSYGMKLIAGLCHELDGAFVFSNNNGTQFDLTFIDTVKIKI